MAEETNATMLQIPIAIENLLYVLVQYRRLYESLERREAFC